jgi:TolB protein
LCFLIFSFTFAFPGTTSAQSRVERIDSREAFNSASSRLSTIDFASVAPRRGFGMYRPPLGLSTNGVTFRVSGGARFGPGIIYVASIDYMGTNPLYQTGTGEMISWGAPNQPGNASLDVTLPPGVTAVGADLWTKQPYVGTIEVIATTEDGHSETVVVHTRNRPDAAFVGFIADKSIVSISFRPPKGQPGLLLDNFSFGKRADGRVVQASANPTPQSGEQVAPTKSPVTVQPTKPRVETSETESAVTSTTSPARPSQSSSTPATAGTIAYIRGGTEIRLIESDGSNDRRLWTHEYAKEGSAIYELSWRPDGKELAFSSAHLNVASLYHADIYAIGADGKGFRKITNNPDHSELARYRKGVVTVTVRNDQPAWKQSQASSGVFFVYVVGADEPQAVTLPPGSSKTLTFKSVADYGAHAQAVVAMYGSYRWFIPGLDVRAGQTTKAPDFSITGDGIELFGAFRPTWRADGSRVSYRSGLCVTSSIASQPNPGEFVFKPLFAGEPPSGACTWDWGPTAALADQLLYTDNSEGSNIYRVREGGTHPGTKVHTFSELNHQILLDLKWLPDGSGFLYSYPDLAYEFGNIFRYDFATRRVTQLTDFKDLNARAFDISPDGQWIVYERSKKWNDDKGVELWIMRMDGSGSRLLVRDGASPSWR